MPQPPLLCKEGNAAWNMQDVILDFLKARLSTEQLTWLTETSEALILPRYTAPPLDVWAKLHCSSSLKSKRGCEN